MTNPPEFPNAEPRKKIVISFDDEPEATQPLPPPPAPARAPAPAPGPDALWSGHSRGSTAPQPAVRPTPPPAVRPTPPPPPLQTQPLPPPAFQPPPPAWPGPPGPAGWAPPPSPLAHVRFASWGARVAAALIDGAIVLVITLAVVFAVGAGVFGASSGSDPDTAGAAGFLAAFLMYFVVSIVLFLLYSPLTMMRGGARNGQTWGKQLVGIRVARLDGRPCTAGTALLRDVLMKNIVIWGFGSFLFYIPGILDSLWPLWDQKKQAWHDMAASTIVTDA